MTEESISSDKVARILGICPAYFRQLAKKFNIKSKKRRGTIGSKLGLTTLKSFYTEVDIEKIRTLWGTVKKEKT